MKLIRLLIIILLFGGHINAYAESDSEDEEGDDWRNANISSMGKHFDDCIALPETVDIETGSTSLNLNDAGTWQPTGAYVTKNKMFGAVWNNSGVTPRPKKYKILYRIDPRFKEPQLFIQEYNYDDQKYHSDFHDYNSGELINKYQDNPELDFPARISLFNEYFANANNDRIPVLKGDVVNITLGTETGYQANSDMSSDLGNGLYGSELSLIYTQSTIADNKMIYSNISKWCNRVDTSSDYCANQKFTNSTDNWKTLTGKMVSADLIPDNLSSCASGANGLDNNLCYYDNGRGIQIKIGGTIIKNTEQPFINFDNTSFLYHKSDVSGNLDFSTDWDIANMYESKNQFMSNWGTLGDNYIEFKNNMTDFKMNHLYFGRYFLNVEIGNSLEAVSSSDLDDIEVEYTIMENAADSPTDATKGTSIDKSYRGNAEKSGYLWLKVKRPDNTTGSIKVNTEHYIGATWFSDVIYNDLINPLRTQFNSLSYIIYIKLANNATLKNIAWTMMTLYISIYGLMFLVGAVQITVTDIVTRVIKIAIIVTLFSETSWTFFNQHLFNVFQKGTDSLLSFVIGNTSQVGNVFGFIDPIINKYTNGNIWSLLLIQFLHFNSGLTFFAVVTVYALYLYFKGLLEVIVGYCIAFLGLAVMISLAPLFIILILFERTKGIFDKWISTLFSYMIQPTLLLIFFLLVDQIITNQISQAVIESCWGSLIDLKISVDLRHLHLPINFSFRIPGLEYIPFYTPNLNDAYGAQGSIMKVATSAMMFLVLAKLIEGSVEYVELLNSVLTNVQAARRSGALQDTPTTPIKNITEQIGGLASPVQQGASFAASAAANAARAPAQFAYNKVINKKIPHKQEENRDVEIDYSKINTAEKQNTPKGTKE